jgi:hypothetical protein
VGSNPTVTASLVRQVLSLASQEPRGRDLNNLSIGIVYQGPLNTALVETLNATPWPQRTILSTWESDPGLLREIPLPPSQIVVGKAPIFAGKGNVRAQKLSTLRGLTRLAELGVEHAWKIRSDFEITRISELTEALMQRMDLNGIGFIDWVLHKGGYPMDFVQFGKTSNLIDLWGGVRTHSLITRVTEKKIAKSFQRQFGFVNEDRNAWKSLHLLASEVMRIDGCDLLWHKRDLSLREDWTGNPVFCQLSGFRSA